MNVPQRRFGYKLGDVLSAAWKNNVAKKEVQVTNTDTEPAPTMPETAAAEEPTIEAQPAALTDIVDAAIVADGGTITDNEETAVMAEAQAIVEPEPAPRVVSEYWTPPAPAPHVAEEAAGATPVEDQPAPEERPDTNTLPIYTFPDPDSEVEAEAADALSAEDKVRLTDRLKEYIEDLAEIIEFLEQPETTAEPAEPAEPVLPEPQSAEPVEPAVEVIHVIMDTDALEPIIVADTQEEEMPAHGPAVANAASMNVPSRKIGGWGSRKRDIVEDPKDASDAQSVTPPQAAPVEPPQPAPANEPAIRTEHSTSLIPSAVMRETANSYSEIPIIASQPDPAPEERIADRVEERIAKALAAPRREPAVETTVEPPVPEPAVSPPPPPDPDQPDMEEPEEVRLSEFSTPTPEKTFDSIQALPQGLDEQVEIAGPDTVVEESDVVSDEEDDDEEERPTIPPPAPPIQQTAPRPAWLYPPTAPMPAQPEQPVTPETQRVEPKYGWNNKIFPEQTVAKKLPRWPLGLLAMFVSIGFVLLTFAYYPTPRKPSASTAAPSSALSPAIDPEEIRVVVTPAVPTEHRATCTDELLQKHLGQTDCASYRITERVKHGKPYTDCRGKGDVMKNFKVLDVSTCDIVWTE